MVIMLATHLQMAKSPPLAFAPMTWHQIGYCVWISEPRVKLFELIQRKKINDSTSDPLARNSLVNIFRFLSDAALARPVWLSGLSSPLTLIQ